VLNLLSTVIFRPVNIFGVKIMLNAVAEDTFPAPL
jgi:hypothetical protein